MHDVGEVGLLLGCGLGLSRDRMMLIDFRVGGELPEISLVGLPVELSLIGRIGSGLFRLLIGECLRTHVFKGLVPSISIIGEVGGICSVIALAWSGKSVALAEVLNLEDASWLSALNNFTNRFINDWRGSGSREKERCLLSVAESQCSFLGGGART